MSENNDNNAIVKEWEKRLSIWIITALVGFIATIAVQMKTQLEVIQANFDNSLNTQEKHGKILDKHDFELKDHEGRLIQIETARKIDK
ncbi:MAG: hypothetical protein ABUK08_00105 [Candidatus Humimicrobiaceae bacterium]